MHYSSLSSPCARSSESNSAASSGYSSDNESHSTHKFDHLANVASQLFEALGLPDTQRQRTGDASPADPVAYMQEVSRLVVKLVLDQSHFDDALKPIALASGPQSALGRLALLPGRQFLMTLPLPERPLPTTKQLLDELGPHLTSNDSYSKHHTLAYALKLIAHDPHASDAPSTLEKIRDSQQKLEIAHRIIAHAYNLGPNAGPIPVEILRKLGPSVLAAIFRLNQACIKLNIHNGHLFNSAVLTTCLRNKLDLKGRLCARPLADTPALHRAVNRELEDPETLMLVMNKLPRHPILPEHIPQSRMFWQHNIELGATQLGRHIPEVFLDDKLLMLEAIKKCGLSYDRLSERLQQDPEIIEAAVRKDGMFLENLPQRYRADRATVLLAVAQNGLALQYASEELHNDEEIVFAAACNCPYTFLFASLQLRDNDAFVDRLMQVNPNCLMHASDRLKYDPERLRQALTHDGHNIQYLDEAHLADIGLCTLAVESRGEAIEFVPHDVFAYRALVMRSFATTQDGFEAHMLLRIAPRLLTDRELVLTAAIRSGECLVFELEDFEGTAAQFNAYRLMVSDDLDILEAGVSDQGLLLFMANEELRSDPDLFEAALLDDPGVLDLAGPDVLDSDDWARRVIETHGECFHGVIEAFSPRIRANAELMLAAVTQNKTNYQHVAPALREDIQFSRRAVTANSDVFKVLSQEHQQDPRVLEIYLRDEVVQRSVEQVLATPL
ncbi:MAG: DUF4116 domain-containing protein [Limnobacter sp.]|nr:DUF4116 domain-containing protein [Limnobacter sp.]